MVASGSPANGMCDVSPYLRVQAESLEEIGWNVRYCLVDDRRSFGGILRNARRLAEEVNRSRPGVVHAQFGSVIAGIACCSRQAVPLVISFCGSDLLGSFNFGIRLRLRDWAARFISIAAAGRAAVLIIKSQNLLDRLPTRLQRNAVILPNGVDVKRFFPRPQMECRSQLGWSMRSKIILFNAGLGENQQAKNLPLAQATVSAVRQSFPDVYFQIISDTNHELMPVLLNAADCLLVTSFSEGSANLPKEAMACGLPVVSVPCGDASERLATTHPGSVCPYDPSALSQAIKEVFSSGKRSNGPEQLVAQELMSQQVARRLVDIYSSVQLRGRTSCEAGEQCVRCA
jgi:teichuronic acid biosynthesis glycosyltransferase TuaC